MMNTRRIATTLVAVAACLVPTAAVAAPAQAATVHNFPAKTDINGRAHIGDAANAPGSKFNAYLAGANVPVVCQQENAGKLWDYTADKWWVPDEYVKTGTSGRAAGVPTCGSTTTPTPTPAPKPTPGKAETPRDDFDHLDRGFAHNQCTAFAAYRVASREVPGFTNNFHGAHFGDARLWPNAARQLGYRVDTTPEVGAIAVNTVHVSSSDHKLHGHVAYINAVYADGSFDIEEYNWGRSRAYSTRKHMHISQRDAEFQQVIHFK